jgi:glycosyltransferase involved in cell wall biosynthesis
MRIAHVTPTYPPYRGGMGGVVFEYTERLRARGHDAHVFTPRYRAVDGDPPYVHRLPALVSVGNAAVTPALVRHLADFDIVHLHYPFFGGAEPVALAQAAGRTGALVLSYYMDATANGVRGLIFRIHRKLVFPRIVRRAARVLVSSRDYAEHSALASVRGGFDRLEVHPYGVDLDRFSPGAEPGLRTTLGIDAHTPVVLFVGGLDRAHDFKGLPVLLAALASVPETSCHLVIVGDGADRTRYQGLADSHGIQNRVHFAGDVADADLPRYYRLAALHVLPSTAAAEAFGLVTIEAAASGVPSVVSGLPGVRTAVVAGETGAIVPAGHAPALASALRDLIQSPELCQQMGRAARLRAEREYAWDPLIERLGRTYRQVIDSV